MRRIQSSESVAASRKPRARSIVVSAAVMVADREARGEGHGRSLGARPYFTGSGPVKRETGDARPGSHRMRP